jgi:hypothetical protein
MFCNSAILVFWIRRYFQNVLEGFVSFVCLSFFFRGGLLHYLLLGPLSISTGVCGDLTNKRYFGISQQSALIMSLFEKTILGA